MRTHSRPSLSDDASTSGLGNVSAIEKALNKTILGDARAADESLIKYESSILSPDSDSDGASGGSATSINTILYVGDVKKEPESSDEGDKKEPATGI